MDNVKQYTHKEEKEYFYVYSTFLIRDCHIVWWPKMQSSLTLVSTTYFSKLFWMDLRFPKWLEEMIRVLRSKPKGLWAKRVPPIWECWTLFFFLSKSFSQSLWFKSCKKIYNNLFCITCLKGRLRQRCITGQGATSI